MTDQRQLPRHLAIIMDGNNRWAKRKLLGGIAGHKAARDAVRAVVEGSARQGIEVLTLFAFSSENWRRPEDEVTALMELFLSALKSEVKKLHKNNIRLKIIGDISGFSSAIQKEIVYAEDLTVSNNGMLLMIAANYGGQWDIVQSVKKLATSVLHGEISVDQITEDSIAGGLTTAGIPDPDLCIRTAGEQRISNFLLWQLAYAEFYFTDVLWPDFREKHLQLALDAYAERVRRFGRTDDQISKMKEKPCSPKE